MISRSFELTLLKNPSVASLLVEVGRSDTDSSADLLRHNIPGPESLANVAAKQIRHDLRFDISFFDEQGNTLTHDDFEHRSALDLLKNKTRDFCAEMLKGLGMLEGQHEFSGKIEAKIHREMNTVFLAIESADLARQVAEARNTQMVNERIFQTFQIRGDESISLDELAFFHGLEFTDLGDEWGWASRHQVMDTPSGWPTKLEAFQHACEHFDIDVSITYDDQLSQSVFTISPSPK